MMKYIFVLAAFIFASSLLTSSASPASGGINGDWDASFTIANQTVNGTLNLQADGAKLTGDVYTAHTGKGTIADGSFNHGKLICTLKFENHESIALTGEFKDDKFSGTFATEGMTGTWTATRK